MKKVLSLFLVITILLSTLITSVIVMANNTDDVTVYDILREESTSPDNLVGASSGVSISMSGSKITTGSYNGYKLNTNGWKMWRPTFFFLTENNGVKSKFMTKQNAKYIVEMEYSVVSNRTDNHSLQVGLFGNIAANGQTESAIWLDTDSQGNKLYNVHPAADNGKTVNYTVAFTAASAHNVGLIFYGQGSVTLNNVKISEVSAEKAANYAVVKYVDGEEASTEFVLKNGSLKTPEKNGYKFGGWYDNAAFNGGKKTAVSSDAVLYAKWVSKSDSDISDVVNSYDVITENVTSPQNAIGSNITVSNNSVTASNYNYSLDYMGWGGTWRPTFLFVTDNNGTKSQFKTKAGAKYIINMDYTVTTTAGNDSWGLQIGLFGNILANGVTSSSSVRIGDHTKYKTPDRGETFKTTTVYTAASAHNIGFQFAGHGTVVLNSITILELPADKVNGFSAVKYVDGDDITAEFVLNGGALKTPVKDDYIFNGWYLDKELSGEAVNAVTADTTLYAKWSVDSGVAVITFHNGNETTTKKYKIDDVIDVIPTKEGYKFLGWYKYSNFIGRPITTAKEGLSDLYAKWEENNPDVWLDIDVTKNETLVTTSKTAQSKVELSDGKLLFDIYNHERQLSSFNNPSTDSWFPAYYLKNSGGQNVELEIGSSYELSVTYKIIDVKAGDNAGLQIGFGADGQPGQTRTKIKGYAVHKAEDEGKEFTYTTSYTAEKFNFGQVHLPKLLFSGQGELEVLSVKIKKIMPIIKDTVIGVQTYEEYNTGTDVGVLGNKKGIEVSDAANHTSGKSSKKSLKLTLNTSYLRLSGNTIISLKQEGELKPYAAEKGAAYRVSFYMYANEAMKDLTWSVNSVDSTLKNDYLTSFYMETQGKVDLKKGEWKKITAYIPALKGCNSSRCLIAIAVASNGYDGKAVYIDDVEIKQLLDSEVLLYNSVGGTELAPERAFKGEKLLRFKEPTKSGYLFDGWYYDAEYKKEAKLNDEYPEDKDELTLYAKWIEEPKAGYDFTAGSFDAEIYKEDVKPYENTIADMDSAFNSESTKGMTYETAWVRDAGIYGNGTSDTDGALAFTNELYSSYNDSYGYKVIRLVNEDGTPYTVVKGERYTIEFDYIFASHKGLSYIIPVISEHSAYTDIGYNSFQTLNRVSVMETDTDYLSYKQSFVAERTGYVYITLTGRDDNANVDTHCYEKVYVDNVKINCKNDVVKLVLKNGNTTWYTLYGVAGEKVTLANAVKEGTNTFDGFYLDAEFKTKFNGYFPNSDSTVYIKIKKDKYDTPSDFSKPIVLDFEETELLEDFYRQQKYMTSWAREVTKEWSLVTGDPQNALNGNNYIRLKGFSHYWNQAKFALYDPNHPENVMLLDKGGKYRVTVMVRCEDIYEVPVNMTVCLENPSMQHLLAENGNVKLEYVPAGDKEGYFMFVGDIEVSENMAYYPTLAIRRNANDLQSIFIDTVSVEKLRDCTVRYEENGGTAVDDAVIQIHDLVFDPGLSFKEGFVFEGWFTDNSFSKKWDFDKDTVENDMTLFAKWAVEIIKDDDDNTFDDTDIELEDSEDNGKAPNLLDADKVVVNKDTNIEVSQNGLSLLMIILICAGALLVLAALAVVIIIFVIKKKKAKAE